MTGMTSRTTWRPERFVAMPVASVSSLRLSGYGIDAAAQQATDAGFQPTAGSCIELHPTKGMVGS